MRENSSLSAPDPRSWQQHREEAEALLAQPIQPGAGTTRVGKSLGLRITPLLSQDQVQLGVSFFPVNLVSARGDQEDEENQADQLALRAFLDGLQAAELPTRLAACEALGQLGNPAARPALEAATQDENRLIQTAARKALSALDASRLKTADLSGIFLLLWQQVKHLWKPVKATQTDQHGAARFANLSAEAVYRLQLLTTQHKTSQPALVFGSPTHTEFLPETLAAESREIDVNDLPQSHRLALEDGSLVCTVHRNEEEQVIVEFRTESPQLRNGWVQCRIIHQETHQEVRSELVALTPNARGVLSGQLLLGEEFDTTQAYELDFDPLPAPSWQV